jgi:hypothetical protein
MNSRSVTLDRRNNQFHDSIFLQVFSLRLPCPVTLRTNTSQLWCSQLTCYLLLGWDFVVGVATGYGLDGPRLNPGRWQEFFLFFITVLTTLGAHTQLHLQCVLSLVPGIKRSVRGNDHALPSAARGKNDCSYKLPSPLCLNGTVPGDHL